MFSEFVLGCFKTEVRYYRAALEIARSLPRETISIGDIPLSDIRPTKLFDIHTIWLNRDDEPRPPLRDQNADFETKGLLQAVEIIRRL